MHDINALFADYAAHHQTKGNKWFHRIGIPLIMITLLGMLSRLEITSVASFRLDAAVLLLIGVELYYLMLDWRLGMAMLGVSLIFYIAGAALPLTLNAALFAVGWILQFIGHSVYEKRQPAFFRNFVHLLVGPLWILNDALPLAKMTSAGGGQPVGDNR